MMAVPSSVSLSKDCCVKYRLYPIRNNSSGNTNFSEVCESEVLEYIAKLAPFLQKYIWQNETFNLHVSRDDDLFFLEGSTNYGDNIEDEWFIVFLLHHLTKEHPDLIVKVEDSDGEFLLIEAAEHLPKWVNPETSENRVYLYRGSIHLVPLAGSPAEVTPVPAGIPTIPEALLTVRGHLEVTRAPLAIQDAILNRIKGYPEKITEMQHRAHCFVPSAVAALLAHCPSLVAPAVSAFYQRDPLDLKFCSAMKYFPPETRVMTEVTFTRCLYAQLVQQKFEPDRRTGWQLPSPRSNLHLSHSLGMKLACGFEILVCRSSQHKEGKKSQESSLNPPDLDLDPRWKAFLTSLKNKGYFKGELEGSKLYKELLQKAFQFYVQSVQVEGSDSSDTGAQILSLLRNVDIDHEKLKAAEKNLRPADSDSWLDVNPDLLDSILEEYSNRNNSEECPNGSRETQLAETITGGLRDFVDGSSGLDGVDPSACRRPHRKRKPQNNNNIDFDADSFADAVKSILYFKEPDSDSLSSSSMSGYSDEEEDGVDDVNDLKGRTLEELLPLKPERPPRRKDRAKKASSSSAAVEEMKQYMAQMDKELADTQVGHSFERAINTNNDDQLNDSIEDESDDFRPVDIDMTALKNILESYSSQGGLPGPASTLLQSMGLTLPEDSDKA